ncbi:hypothetical protein GCM10025791_43670 [Halioxenophilus aromaticivorans]|uniref:Uncharacterized protein n=1 Tax=Halioxenophilus aromaticivorans TaxID=1306992 RepID=A0AAV3U8F4_9ALTE
MTKDLAIKLRDSLVVHLSKIFTHTVRRALSPKGLRDASAWRGFTCTMSQLPGWFFKPQS